jgi:hypothetical protein
VYCRFLRGKRRYRVESLHPPAHLVTSTVLWETIRNALYFEQIQYYANPNVTRLQGREVLTKQRPCCQFRGLEIHPRGRMARYPLDRIWGGSQTRFGTCGVKKNLCPFRKVGPRFPFRPPCSLVPKLRS